ncbi:N-6 DNA methylase [Methylobacterium sp. GXS13]|uniref:Eco57I restriction-modification methylase domain-containing protein n=1 Tax=Methylobacterium sp. GXS13 TaxID=1730094 RepID=UPI0009EAC3BC|nr:N-6 DNA methylase [Methylobacterium sp. GXS13]
MARAPRRTAEIGLTAISVEGGLIAPAQIAAIAAAVPSAADYGAPKGVMLRDEITRYFRIAQAHWRGYARLESPNATQAAAFVQGLLSEAFGFDDLAGPASHELSGHYYRITFEARSGRVPIVVAAPLAVADAFHKALPEFGDGVTGGQSRRSPTMLLQDWLNASEGALWGIVFSGDRLRLMRDNASFTRPAWIEADLGAILRDEMFADFTVLWLLIHASRFGAAGTPVSECALERWREAGAQAGTAARERLGENVVDVLEKLGQGLIDANPNMRDRMADGRLALPAFFEQLLRLVYRLIFLAVAEERGLLHVEAGSSAARLYAENYGFTYLRERSSRRAAYDHHGDAWEGMKIVFAGLARGEPILALPALGGLFAPDATPHLDGAAIPNHAFLAAVFRLSWLIERDGRRVRINWRDMATEELGSVYEGLLELVPVLANHGRTFTFAGGAEARGNARKLSGSYYTPDKLVQALLDATLDPVLERAEAEGGEDAILRLTVIDPACGSAHFLLGAARRMALRVATLRDPDAPDIQAALRDVVRHCIHGVDRNPMAVELAKVALWIETVQPGKPLGFLDANIRCGDALLGVFDLDALSEGIPDEAYKPLTGDDKETATWFRKRNKAEREGQASFDWERGDSGLPPARLARDDRGLRALPEDSPDDIQTKRALFVERNTGWRADKAACDLYVAAFLTPKTGGVPENFNTATIPTTGAVRTRLAVGEIFGPLEECAIALAEGARAFHWPLMFPAAMETGGFDVVLGNPPWERIKLQEQEYFATRAPEIATASNAAERGRLIRALAVEQSNTSGRRLWEDFRLALRVAEASSVFFTAPKDEDPTKGSKPGPRRRFAWTGRGDVNTYALFAELFLNLMRSSGRAGIIVPTGIATDATTAPFFAHLIEKKRLAEIASFENEEFIFPGVHHSYRFSILILSSSEGSPYFSSYLRDVAQLADSRRRFAITPADIKRLNPNTKTAPVFRSRADAELTARIYARVPVLFEEGRGAAGNPWGTSFMAMFHMSNDSHLFRTAAQLTAAGMRREDQDWVRGAATKPSKVRAEPTELEELAYLETSENINVASERWAPLYEAKMIHQFDHRWATYDGGESRDATMLEKSDPAFEAAPRYWVPAHEVTKRTSDKGWRHKWLMGWRDIARSHDIRTTIAGVVPACGFGDKFLLLLPSTSAELCGALIACLNSLVTDFVARQKLGGTSFKYFTMRQIAVIPPTGYRDTDIEYIIPRILELTYVSHTMAHFARDLGYCGSPFAWDEGRRAQLRAELDAWYAHAYGLTRDELRYVLDPKETMGADYPSETFRVLQASERRRFGEYRTARLVLAAYDVLHADGTAPPAFRGGG